MRDKSIITKCEMAETIERSGYLLEQRVEAILEKRKFYVSANAAYPDPITGKSRELDIDAIKWYKISRDYDSLFCRLLCECENNIQPVVLFIQSRPDVLMTDEVFKCAGTPVQFKEKTAMSKPFKIKDETVFTSLFHFLNIGKFHHYGKSPIATQYCTFTRKNKNKPWIALHSDRQHETVTKLINFLEADIDDYYNSYVPPGRNEVEQFNINIYYLVLVLQGPLYAASTIARKLKLTKSQHIQLRKETFSKDKHDTYQIDIVTEKAFPKYLTIVHKEMQKINNRLKRKKKLARASADLLIKLAKKKSEKQSYREIFEF